MDDIVKTIKSLENSGETVKNTKRWIFGMLLWILGASFLGNMSTGKEVMRAGRGYNIMDYMD